MSRSISGGAPAAATESRGAAARRRRGRLIALGILAACAAPFLAAVVAYRFFPPAGRVNYGELLEAKPLPAARLARLDGAPFSLAELRGKWVLLQADGADCGAACRAKLFSMRQARLAQGQNMDRVERVWLLLDDGVPPAEIARLYDGVAVVHGGAALSAALPGADARDRIFLIDPLGLLILRFPANADPKGIIGDLQRLLKYSSVG